MENYKIILLKEVPDLIKMFGRGDEEDRKMFWIDTIIKSMSFEYEDYTTQMIKEYNENFDLLESIIDDLELNKASRDKLENVLKERKDLKVQSTYTATQAKAIKKYRSTEKGKEKNNELSRKYYNKNKDIPEKFEKIQESEKKSYEKLKSDPERYRKYLDRKKELYKRRKEEQEKAQLTLEGKLEELSLDDMILDQNIINPQIN
jgi:hypothetical protein